jgi:hypothetical protein
MARAKQSGRWVVEQIVLPDQPLSDVLSGAREAASFEDKDEARRWCAELEREARRLVNPFLVRTGLAGMTSLEPGVFCDWLLDAGIEPPPEPYGADWPGWYDRCQAGWDEAKRERFWKALDLLRFYRVVERVSRRCYVVLEVGWLWYDEPPYDTAPECRRAVEAFSSRTAAERRRCELDRQRQQEWAHVELSPPDASLFEVVEVDWEADP